MFPKQTFYEGLGSFTVSGANTITFTPGRRVAIKRILFAFTTANTTTKNVITVESRPIAGTAANEVDLGDYELPAVSALGAIYYIEPGKPFDNVTDPAADGSVVTVAGAMPIVEAAGDLTITSDGGGTAGVCNVFVEYVAEPVVAGVDEDDITLVDRVA